MKISKINLNLLKVFLMLMQERHVTAAAKKLFITQPAVSNSLNQLRKLFNDELFIRGRREIIPTQKSVLLLPSIQQALLQIEDIIFYNEKFDYKTSDRMFRLGMSDYAEFVILPQLYASINKIAPNISFVISPFRDYTPDKFESGELELGIGLDRKFPKQINSEVLYKDSTVCVISPNNPILQTPLTLEKYLHAEHITYVTYNGQESRVDLALQKMNLERKIKLFTSDITPAFQIIKTSKTLVGTFSQHITTKLAELHNLKYVEAPFAIPKMSVIQAWHRQQENDSGLLWLRQVIKEVCQKNLL